MCRKLIDFDILIDDAFVNICTDSTLSPIDKSFLLSVANGFEDGKWRQNVFRNFIFNNMAETGLSAREREALANDHYQTLVSAAQKLRIEEKISDNSGGEIGEIMLYGIMKHHFKALPVVPKIFYKQNARDYAKGADSVHITLTKDKNFELWLGEAKFYNSIEDTRFDDPIASIEEMLSAKKLRDENSMITNLHDLDVLLKDAGLSQKIREALSTRESLDDIKKRLHVPILLLHECDITNVTNEYNQAYKDAIVARHKERANAYFKKMYTKLNKTVHQLETIQFHLILFPVPCKANIVEDFMNRAKVFQSDGNN